MTDEKDTAATVEAEPKPAKAEPKPAAGARPKPAARAKADPKPATRPGLRVTGPAKGFWRAGRRFGPEPVEIALGNLTEAQAEAIAREPMLSVVEIEMPAGDAGD